MDILSIIEKKRLNINLNKEEIDYAFKGYLDGSVEDYQMSSLLMAICINGMSLDETIYLTDVMLNSGVRIDTSLIDGILVDKHSTGGVGDKTTLIIGPIVASCGLKMAKLSGRGLGITGGTIDKLESIPGMRVNYTIDEFLNNVNKVGLSIMSQTPDITPLDKKIYSLRDVSGTTASVPLIASSIMSKKIAVGAKYIAIDLKVGEGALIKDVDTAKELASVMVQIGKRYGLEVMIYLTDMNKPLGNNVGNALEVKEAIDVLKGKRGELRNLSVMISAGLLSKAKNIDIESATREAENAIDSGNAYRKFTDFVSNQGGDLNALRFAPIQKQVLSTQEGVIEAISAKEIANTSKMLGAGRNKKTDLIDYGVGIVLNKIVGESVKVGDVIATIYQKDEKDYDSYVQNAFKIVK